MIFGALPPSNGPASAVSAPAPATSPSPLPVSADGLSIAVTLPAPLRANIVFPSSDAVPDAKIAVTALVPLTGEIARIAFTVDRSVTFEQFPSLYVASPALAGRRPAFVHLRDATAGRDLADLDASAYGEGTFLGGTWHEPGAPFRAVAGHRYEASVVDDSTSLLAIEPSRSPIRIPAIRGIRATLSMPTLEAGNGAAHVHLSVEPPVAVPRLPERLGGAVLAYATLVPLEIATYDGTASLTVTLPRLFAHGRYGLAVFDDGAWFDRWIDLARANVSRDGELRFAFDLQQKRLEKHRYVVALFRDAAPKIAERSAASEPAPLLAVVGDSFTVLAIVPPSPVDCTFGFGPAPNCQYAFDPTLEVASIAGRQAGYRVQNLSNIATTSTVSDAQYESQLEDEVPQIDPATSVVVVASGTADTVLAADGGVASRLTALSEAIRRRAPHARLVYIGVRYYLSVANIAAKRAVVDAWNATAAALGERYGAYLDPGGTIPSGLSPYSPDGGHLSVLGARALARELEPLLRDADEGRIRDRPKHTFPL